VRAIHTAFKSDLGIDLKQLSFLADKPLLLEKLAYAERLYLDLVETIDEYRKVHVQIQEATASAFAPHAVVTFGQVEKAIPSHLTAQANTLLASIFDHLDRDEESYRAVAAELSAELKRRLGRSLLLRCKQKVAEFKSPPEEKSGAGLHR